MELLNNLYHPHSRGGTGRGISPAYAGHYSKTSLYVRNFLAPKWRDILGAHYDLIARRFSAYDLDIAQIEVPNLRMVRDQSRGNNLRVGSREEFLDRIAEQRDWFLARERSVPNSKRMFRETFEIHLKAYQDAQRYGFVFEGA